MPIECACPNGACRNRLEVGEIYGQPNVIVEGTDGRRVGVGLTFDAARDLVEQLAWYFGPDVLHPRKSSAGVEIERCASRDLARALGLALDPNDK